MSTHGENSGALEARFGAESRLPVGCRRQCKGPVGCTVETGMAGEWSRSPGWCGPSGWGQHLSLQGFSGFCLTTGLGCGMFESFLGWSLSLRLGVKVTCILAGWGSVTLGHPGPAGTCGCSCVTGRGSSFSGQQALPTPGPSFSVCENNTKETDPRMWVSFEKVHSLF